MKLGEIIKILKKYDSEKIVKNGFKYPHSYRGFYFLLAFEPAQNVSIKSMLECAKSAVGKTFIGYKGGEFTMDESTECFLAEYGNCQQDDEGDDGITEGILYNMLDN